VRLDFDNSLDDEVAEVLGDCEFQALLEEPTLTGFLR
jgi:hypothetical protein